jgi:hypothetical protein
MGWPAGTGSWSYTSRPAPAILPDCKAAISAAWSINGPRLVFTTTAPGFIIANSCAPMMPRERSERIRCRVRISACCSSSSLLTLVAPAAAAFSSVRFWLQPMSFIPKAAPTLATRLPRLPRPMTPSVIPSSAWPSFTCQRPCRIAASCSGM